MAAESRLYVVGPFALPNVVRIAARTYSAAIKAVHQFGLLTPRAKQERATSQLKRDLRNQAPTTPKAATRTTNTTAREIRT